uniref:Uncharacterized protein n=1 Tax=Lotus japonicus TaxID=34305 RepID=I3T6Z6_LOTJA|nr:unknown [Lotus japonicus]
MVVRKSSNSPALRFLRKEPLISLQGCRLCTFKLIYLCKMCQNRLKTILKLKGISQPHSLRPQIS